MSNHDACSELSLFRDCPPMDDDRTVQRISSRSAEIGGGISVNRLIPTRQRRMIGAWCFLDHAGPARFDAGTGMRVGPHPHIGLQTFTWMIEGEVLHRDSLGNQQVIRPGQVNLMTAGRGITHTEESLPDQRVLHAAQLWIALPSTVSACDPAFEHYPVLPTWHERDCRITLLAGADGARTAPTRQHSPLVGMDLFSERSVCLDRSLDPAFEYGILVLEGEVRLEGERFSVNELAFLSCGSHTLRLELASGSRALVLGGAPFAEQIVMWWNFVGHSKAEIAQAQRDWEEGDARFGRVDDYDGAPLAAPPLPWADD